MTQRKLTSFYGSTIGKWTCDLCTLENMSYLKKCDACSSPAPQHAYPKHVSPAFVGKTQHEYMNITN